MRLWGMTYWQTKDGRKLEVAWMDSAHLVNTLNMLFRTGNNPQAVMKTAVYKEVARRGLMKIENIGMTTPILVQPAHRETPIEMCMVRALLDNPDGHKYYLEFLKDRAAFMERAGQDPVLTNVWQRFVKYRMTHT
jgi:hypothetical protein